MPVFCFRTDNGKDVDEVEGMSLPDQHSARIEAIRLTGTILAHEPDQLGHSGQWRVEVIDEDRRTVCTVTTSIGGPSSSA